MASKLPLIVIVGPTASGKTGLAIKLAEKYNGEIICADSRTIYKYMDIGTAKPTPDERARVLHWGLDLVEPGARFTAADFKEYALQKIDEIRGRGHVPFLVGGTGLYVDGVIFDYGFGGDVDEVLRRRFDSMELDELHKYCYKNNIKLPVNKLNKRHVIREIERIGSTQKSSDAPLDDSIVVGITTDRDVLRTRIEQRSEQLFENGVVDEAIMLGKKYGWDNEAMTGNIYPLVHQHLENKLTLSEVQQKFTILDWRLAKRQLTWLRRNQYITWKNLEEAEHYLSDVLARSTSS